MREVGWALMHENGNIGAAYWKQDTSRDYVDVMAAHFDGAVVVTLYVAEEE